jgi:hypothetical protein
MESVDSAALESYGITWNHMESRGINGITWNHVESRGINGINGITWNQRNQRNHMESRRIT